MAKIGFNDTRTGRELEGVPGNPKSKTFVANSPGRGLLTGAILKLQSTVSKARAALSAQLTVRGSGAKLPSFKPLGAQLVENETQAPFPRLTNQPTSSPLARGVTTNTAIQEKLRNQQKFVRVGTGTPPSFGKFLTLASLLSSRLFNPKLGKMFGERGANRVWSEPPTPYAAAYPYNQVQETESGHVMEVDDTPGAERLHAYHRSGSFVELHPDGTIVIKSVKDMFRIVLSDDHLSVAGNCHVSIQGDASVYVKGNLDAQVDGGAALNIKGQLKAFAKAIELNAKTRIKLDAPVIDLKYMSLPSGFRVAAGVGGVVPKPVVVPTASALGAVGGVVSGLTALMPQVPDYPVLALTNPDVYAASTSVASRVRMFDSPDEMFDMTEYQQHLELSRDLGDFDVSLKTIPGVLSLIDDTPSATEPVVDLKDPDAWQDQYTVAATTSLSTFFTLGDLAPNGVVAQLGLLEDDIVYRLQLLAVNALDPIKQKYPDMTIVDGFRVSNSGKSQHEIGEAVDFTFPNGTYAEMLSRAQWIRDNVAYDQLVLNWTNLGDLQPWIHISFTGNIRRREVFTKDFTDTFHDGLMIVSEYQDTTERQAALEASTAEIASLTTELTRQETRDQRIEPVTADTQGAGDATEANGVPEGYIQQWGGSRGIVIDTMNELIGDEPDLWDTAHNGTSAGGNYVRELVRRLRAKGVDCACNGKRGNVSDISQDVICFPNPTGSRDAAGIKEGLEVYDIIQAAGSADAKPKFDDITSGDKISLTAGAWVSP